MGRTASAETLSCVKELKMIALGGRVREGTLGVNLGQQGAGLQAQEAERPPTGASLQAALEVDEMWRELYRVVEAVRKTRQRSLSYLG